MESSWNENRAELQGTLAAEPSFSYESHGTRYYLFPLDVKRLSGVSDVLNIASAQELLHRIPENRELPLSVSGEIRSFNNKSGVGNRLIITVLAREINAGTEAFVNRLQLTGTLCKAPILRKTPLGREICDLILAVNRRYGRADYIPCIAWGKLAREAGALQVGDRIRIEGRLQSRSYIKTEEGIARERTAFEVSIMQLKLL